MELKWFRLNRGNLSILVILVLIALPLVYWVNREWNTNDEKSLSDFYDPTYEFCLDNAICSDYFNRTFQSVIWEYMNNLVPNYPIPALGIGIVQNENILWLKNFGNENFLDTQYIIGSITKVFTATAILKLMDEGLIRLNNDVNLYLKEQIYNPKFPSVNITVHDLLSHRSGLKRDVMDWNDYEPGTSYSYSNYGYGLLGRIIENVTGIPYIDYLDNEFFTPMKMINTGLFTDPTLNYNLIPGGGYLGKELTTKPSLPADLEPAGAILSTIHDLSKWLILHMNAGIFENRRYLNNTTSNLIQSKISVLDDSNGYRPNSTYGYGWSAEDLNKYRLQGHDGGIRGFTSFMFYLSNYNVGYVILIAQDFGFSLPNFILLKELFLFVCDIIGHLTAKTNLMV